MDIGSGGASKEVTDDSFKSVLNGLSNNCQLAERLRAAAGEVGGRMSVDWANCEMRSIELTWMPAGSLQGTAAAAAGGGGSMDDGSGSAAGLSSGAVAAGWLWATPGNGGEWWPGACGAEREKINLLLLLWVP
jgi:hypothetical protein